MMLIIRDLSKSCGMEVYRVEKSDVIRGCEKRNTFLGKEKSGAEKHEE